MNTTGDFATMNFFDGADKIVQGLGEDGDGTINLEADFNTFNMGEGGDSIENLGGSFVNMASGTINTFYFGNGRDLLLNASGSTINADGLLNNFFFDTPTTFCAAGADPCDIPFIGNVGPVPVDVPIPWTDEGDGKNDEFKNTGLETEFNATGLQTGFWFGGGKDVMINEDGASFIASSLVNIFWFGTGQDMFRNDNALFDTTGGGLTYFNFGDNQDQFFNSNGAAFFAGENTYFVFGDGKDTFTNDNALFVTLGGSGPFPGVAFDFGKGADEFINQNGAAFFTNQDDGLLTLIDFGRGSDTFYNRTGAEFYTENFTVLDFGAGNNDQLINTSYIKVNDSLRLYNLELFDNAGGMLDMVDGDTEDYVDQFHGDFGGGGELAIDAELMPGGSADQLLVGGDTVNGGTLVEVNDLDDNPGVLDTQGVVFAEVDGTTNDGDFYLNAPINKGLFDYDIYLRDSGHVNNESGVDEWILASVINVNGQNLANVGAAAGTLWHQSAGTWLQRSSDLRTLVLNGAGEEESNAFAPGGNGSGVGAWAKLYAGQENRDTSNSMAGPVGPVTTTDRSEQTFAGAVAGLDIADGEGWLVGVFGGYGTSNVEFNSGVDIDFTATSVGGYANFINGGFFIDAMVKADFGEADYTAVGDGDNSFETDYFALGGVIDTGYRFEGESKFFEPGATLAYVNTDVDKATLFGSPVSFKDGESLRGRLGGRLGTFVDKQTRRVEAFVEGSAWHEFEGNSGASFVAGGFSSSVSQDNGGTFGEVGLGINVLDMADNWSTFARGNYQFGEDNFQAVSVQAGFKKQW